MNFFTKNTNFYVNINELFLKIWKSNNRKGFMSKKQTKKIWFALLSTSSILTTPLVALACKRTTDAEEKAKIQKELDNLNIEPKKEKNGNVKQIPQTAFNFLKSLEKDGLTLKNKKLLEYFNVTYGKNFEKQLKGKKVSLKGELSKSSNQLKLTLEVSYLRKDKTLEVLKKEFILENFVKDETEYKFEQFSKDLSLNLKSGTKKDILPTDFIKQDLSKLFEFSKGLGDYKAELKAIANNKTGQVKLIATFSINGRKLSKTIEQDFDGFKKESFDNVEDIKVDQKPELKLVELLSFLDDFNAARTNEGKEEILNKLFNLVKPANVNTVYTKAEVQGKKFKFFYKYTKEVVAGTKKDPNKKEIIESEEKSIESDFSKIIDKFQSILNKFKDYKKGLKLNLSQSFDKSKILSSQVNKTLAKLNNVNPDYEVTWRFIFDDVKGKLTIKAYFKDIKENLTVGEATFVEEGFKKDEVDKNHPELTFTASGYTQNKLINLQKDLIEPLLKDKNINKYFDIKNLQNKHNVEIKNIKMINDGNNIKLEIEYRIYKTVIAGTQDNPNKMQNVYSEVKKTQLDLTDIIKTNANDGIDDIFKGINLKEEINKSTTLPSSLTEKDFEQTKDASNYDIKYTLIPNDKTGELSLQMEFTFKYLKSVKKTITKSYKGFKQDFPEGNVSVTRNEKSDILDIKGFANWNKDKLDKELWKIGDLTLNTKDKIHWTGTRYDLSKLTLTYKLYREVIVGRNADGTLKKENIFTDEKEIELDFKDILEKNQKEFAPIKKQIEKTLSILHSLVIPESATYSRMKIKKEEAIKNLEKALNSFSLNEVKNIANKYNEAFANQLDKELKAAHLQARKVIESAQELKGKIDQWISLYNQITYPNWDIKESGTEWYLGEEIKQLENKLKNIKNNILDQPNADPTFLQTFLNQYQREYIEIEKKIIPKFQSQLEYKANFLFSRIKEINTNGKKDAEFLKNKYANETLDKWDITRKPMDLEKISQIINWWINTALDKNQNGEKESLRFVNEIKKLLS